MRMTYNIKLDKQESNAPFELTKPTTITYGLVAGMLIMYFIKQELNKTKGKQDPNSPSYNIKD